MNSISAPEPSLSSRAMLCSLSISMWSARKHDPEASEEIAQRHGAQPDAGQLFAVPLATSSGRWRTITPLPSGRLLGRRAQSSLGDDSAISD
jgi:hypothetical protein